MDDTVWTQRTAGQQVSSTHDGKDSDELDEVALVVVDPSLSPNWLRFPPELGDIIVRVEGSCWMPLAPNPNWQTDGEQWLNQRTRWHVLRGMPLVVAEVIGHGWVVVDIGPERRAVLREACGLLADTAEEVCDA